MAAKNETDSQVDCGRKYRQISSNDVYQLIYITTLNYSNTDITEILSDTRAITVTQGTPPACINLDSAPGTKQVDYAISTASATGT